MGLMTMGERASVEEGCMPCGFTSQHSVKDIAFFGALFRSEQRIPGI